jgi:hypothetical protein
MRPVIHLLCEFNHTQVIGYGCSYEIKRGILWTGLPLRLGPSRDGERQYLRSERTPATGLAVLVRFPRLDDGVQLTDFCRV